MSDIKLKKTLFTRSVEGTGKKGESTCTIRASTVVLSGFWKYEVAVDEPENAFRTSGQFLQILQDMKKSPLGNKWLELLKKVSGTVCDTYGSAVHFFTDEQMLAIAALKNRTMTIEEMADLLAIKRHDALSALTGLESLELVARDSSPSPDVMKKAYRLEWLGEMIHGILMEDRKFCLVQATVDTLMR